MLQQYELPPSYGAAVSVRIPRGGIVVDVDDFNGYGRPSVVVVVDMVEMPIDRWFVCVRIGGALPAAAFEARPVFIGKCQDVYVFELPGFPA